MSFDSPWKQFSAPRDGAGRTRAIACRPVVVGLAVSGVDVIAVALKPY